MKIGIDIGGTQIRIGRVENNKLIKVETFDNDVKNREKSLNKIFNVIDDFNEENNLESIGICSPGPLDLKNGMILQTPNLEDWNNFNIKKAFEDKFKVPTFLQNDANVAALGQYSIRNDSSIETLLFFTISTGIGSGFVIDEKIYSGYQGLAFEIANAMPIVKTKEDKAIGTGIEYLGSGKNIPIQLQKLGVNVKDAKEAFELYEQNVNAMVNDYFEKMSHRFVEMFSTAVYFLNPQIIVLGGSVALNNKKFFKDIFRRVDDVVANFSFKVAWDFSIDPDVATLLGCANIK